MVRLSVHCRPFWEIGDRPQPPATLAIPNVAAIPVWSWRYERSDEDRRDAAVRSWLTNVQDAYQTRYESLRPLMRARGQVSCRATLLVAAHMARCADWATGRNCRPSNGLLVDRTGLSLSTVQRARRALRLLGVATEVFRGRLRSRIERLVSWRIGDRRRGWTSVYALHGCRPVDKSPVHGPSFSRMAPHPRGCSLGTSSSVQRTTTTHPAGANRRPSGVTASTRQRLRPDWNSGPDPAGLKLAREWRRDRQTPGWARRHTPHGWASTLARAETAGWEAADINALITEWQLANWLPPNPYRPIGLLRAILATHTNWSDRPADVDRAREAAEAADFERRRAAAARQRDELRAAQAAGAAAVGSAGHQAALQAAAAATRNAAARRTREAAIAAAALDAAVRQARKRR